MRGLAILKDYSRPFLDQERLKRCFRGQDPARKGLDSSSTKAHEMGDEVETEGLLLNRISSSRAEQSR